MSFLTMNRLDESSGSFFHGGMWYRLNQPILAVRKETADLRFALPSGALLNIVVEAPARGLVEAEWNAEVVRMFVEDVRSRGIRVEIINFE